jgi:hypothetical protein
MLHQALESRLRGDCQYTFSPGNDSFFIAMALPVGKNVVTLQRFFEVSSVMGN